MRKPIAAIRKKRGRPATGLDPMISVRVPPIILAALDNWIAERPAPKPSRSETVRAAVKAWLVIEGRIASPEAASRGSVVENPYGDVVRSKRIEADPGERLQKVDMPPPSAMPKPAAIIAAGKAARSKAGAVVDKMLEHEDAPADEKARRKRKLTRVSKGMTGK